MPTLRASKVWICLFVACFAWPLGCREREYSGEPYPENLGDGGTVLMPAPARFYAPNRALEGQAELTRLGEATEEPAIAAVRELIADYNGLVAEKAYDDLPLYFVERQQETVTKLVEMQGRLTGKLDELLAAVREKSPDSTEAVNTLRGQIVGQSMDLNVDDLTLVSETEVTGKIVLPQGAPAVPGLDLTVYFKLIDEEWYIEQPMLDLVAMMLPMMPQIEAQLDAMIAQINSGEMDPAAIAQQIQMMAAMFGGGQDAGEQPLPEGEDEEIATEEEGEEEKEEKTRPLPPGG